MNKENLQIIINKYIENFDMFNNAEHKEYYKWEIANAFPSLMSSALSSSDEAFPEELLKIKKLTENIIDNYTTPFYGLCKLSKEEPDTVRKLFKGLYADDEGDIRIKEKKIKDFIDQSNKLSEKYYPGTYLYKNDLHSVTGYLFLNDPDNSFLYKATHCNNFADCIGFFESWGSKDDFDLSVFYRMCNQVLEELKQSKELMETNALRYDGRFHVDLHPDKNLHILLFDIIYCCSTYDLFDGMKFEKTNRSTSNKEAKIRQMKAEQAKTDVELYQKQLDKISDLKERVCSEFSEGSLIKYKKTDDVIIREINKEKVSAKLINANGEEKKISLITCCLNGLLPVNDNLLSLLKENADILANQKRIEDEYRKANEDLERYGD